MSSIAVIVDTDASLPEDVAAAYGIRQVPIAVHFGEETFKTGVDIDDEALFERVDQVGALPTTSAPAPGDFLNAYKAAFEEGADAVLCLCVSSAVSGTYKAALAARDLIPERDITVVDTQSISMGQGFMAIAAAEALRSGASRDEAIAQAESVRGCTSLFGALSTLKYLAMSGRVGHLAAGMASVLRVKPILTLQNGKLEMLERVRTRRRAWERMIELTRQALDGHSIERMALLHVDAEEDALQFGEQMRDAFTCPDEFILAELTPGLSVHTGAGIVGVVCVASANIA